MPGPTAPSLSPEPRSVSGRSWRHTEWACPLSTPFGLQADHRPSATIPFLQPVRELLIGLRVSGDVFSPGHLPGFGCFPISSLHIYKPRGEWIFSINGQRYPIFLNYKLFYFLDNGLSSRF